MNKTHNPTISRFDYWSELIMIILSKLITDNLPSFQFRLPRKQNKLPAPLEITSKLWNDLSRISQLYLYSGFDTKEIHPQLMNAFYNVMIRVTKDLLVTDLLYYSQIFTSKNIRSQQHLIDFFEEARNYPSRNDSRYMLGFRSLWYILRENRHNLTPEYMQSIFIELKPFFDQLPTKKS